MEMKDFVHIRQFCARFNLVGSLLHETWYVVRSENSGGNVRLAAYGKFAFAKEEGRARDNTKQFPSSHLYLDPQSLAFPESPRDPRRWERGLSSTKETERREGEKKRGIYF